MEKTVERNYPYGSYEHWYHYLHDYMVRYHFPMDDDTLEDIKSIAESATKIYDFERSTGNAMGASELAIQRLFSSIGDSVYEVIQGILEDVPEFAEAIDVSDARWVDFWVDTLSQIPGIFDGCEKDFGYGLDHEYVERYYGRIVKTIRNFLIKNDFLQPIEDSE